MTLPATVESLNAPYPERNSPDEALMTEPGSTSSLRSGADHDIQRRRRVVWLLAAAAAVGTVRSGAEPTASTLANALVNGACAVVVVYLSSRARRWAWLVMAGGTTLAAASAAALVAGGAALLVGFVSVAVDRRSRVTGALVGALAIQALFRLPDWERQGVATLVAVAAVVPVLVSGYRNCRPAIRRRLLVGVSGVVVGALVLSATAIVVALGQHPTLQDGIDQARDGLRAAENGQTRRAEQLLGDAEQSFGRAADALQAPWMVATTGVPVVGQNVEALAVAAHQGARLAATAREALIEADIDSLRFEDGALDMDLVRAVGPPLERSAASLETALDNLEAANSPWLLMPVSDRYDDFSQELADAAADAELAGRAIEVAPALFGADGDRRYLVLFTTPAEMRGLGGFIGNYGELTAVDGDLELTRSGQISELRPGHGNPPYAITGPADFLARWGRYQPGRFVQDITYSPDFPSVAQVWEEVYPQTRGGAPIDGVIVVDPYALAALMTFTGPITVPGYDVALTSENAADILLREQYLSFEDDRDQRKDFLDDVTRLTFEALTTGDLPGPRQVTEVLGPVVAQGRLLVHSVQSDEQGFFESIDLDGALPPVDGDFLSVTTQNSGNNKIDIFLHREIRYDVRYDPDTGRVQGEVTVTLRNDAPASGLPSVVIGNRDTERIPVGANLMYLSVYTPWEIVAATLEGQPIPVEQAEELGRPVYGTFVQVPPGGTRTVTFALDGVGDPSYDYRLTFAPQPLVSPDRLVVDLTGADGWRICTTDGFELEGTTATLDLQPQEDFTATAEFCAD